MIPPLYSDPLLYGDVLIEVTVRGTGVGGGFTQRVSDPIIKSGTSDMLDEVVYSVSKKLRDLLKDQIIPSMTTKPVEVKPLYDTKSLYDFYMDDLREKVLKEKSIFSGMVAIPSLDGVTYDEDSSK